MSDVKSACVGCAYRYLSINKYDDFVNECLIANNKKINCNIFTEHPEWCPKYGDAIKYIDNGDVTFSEITEKGESNG